MQLNLIEESSGEIITLEETKNYLCINHDFDDSLISILIKSTREALEAIIQKSILKQVWEYKMENQPVSNFYFNSNDYPNIFKNTLKISLPKPPIRKILAVKINEEEIDLNKCSLNTIGDRFCLCIVNNFLAKKSKISFSIRYETGISDDVGNIPYQLKLANLMLM
ncbi:MAG: head-tail connector protein, partial [Holosporaceae bacterium]|nr:head-tail connector protein [Holosporaceae bacterium]